MAAWKFWMANRIEGKTGTFISGAENSSYPVSNAVDEDPQTVFKPNTTDDTVVRFDLGTALSIEGWAVGQHTLSSQTAAITLKYSATDNSADAWGDLTQAATWTPSNDNNYCKAFDAATKRYWWVGITSQDAAVEVGEIALFDVTRTLTRYPRYPLGTHRILNQAVSETLGGYRHVSKRGESKMAWTVDFANMDYSTDYDYLFGDLAEEYTEGYRPFWLTTDRYVAATGQAAHMVHIPWSGGRVNSMRERRDLHRMSFEIVECD